MPELTTNTNALRQQVYDLRLRASRVQQELVEATDPARVEALLAEAGQIQAELAAAEQALETATAKSSESGVLLRTTSTDMGATTRGAATTKLEAIVRLRMEHVPTATCHLLSAEENPLVEIEVQNTDNRRRRVRVTSRVDQYSADAVTTIELNFRSKESVLHLPTFFPDQIRRVRELTRATLTVLVEDLEAKDVELHRSFPIWLLSRNTAPLAVRDPASGAWNDLSRYFGAFVTPNAPAVMKFLRNAARLHPDGRLSGYLSDVTSQVRALYGALRQDADIAYVNSIISFNPEESARGQRVRLPRESLRERQANCMDGTLLFASLLEAASLNPAIVIVPQHALVAWETAPDSDQWEYLETTMIGTNDFPEANDIGRRKAAFWAQQAQTTGRSSLFRRWPLRELRTRHGITPLE
ncbi:MAG: hypothetical protein H3C34_10525 [Caldilineaceae bacterium]|nr:hypothetical protein [Caldilineaceae bacterium]